MPPTCSSPEAVEPRRAMDVEQPELEDMSGWWEPGELEECPACGGQKVTPASEGGGTRLCLACGEFQAAKSSPS